MSLHLPLVAPSNTDYSEVASLLSVQLPEMTIFACSSFLEHFKRWRSYSFPAPGLLSSFSVVDSKRKNSLNCCFI